MRQGVLVITEKAQGESGEQAAAADTASAERQGDDAAGHVVQGGLCVCVCEC